MTKRAKNDPNTSKSFKAATAAATNTASEQEEILQAVVIADSFNERFMPITLDKPRCLLPLANVPLIEYTLEFLALSGVQEVILFCRSHADQIKQYVAGSRWALPTSSTTITTLVVSPEAASVGDALREIDARQLVHGDFVLVHGDLVSNFNLAGILESHKKRRQVDKSVVMTMVLERASPFHRSRERGESAVFALDSRTGDCVGYEPVLSERTKRYATFSTELLDRALAVKSTSLEGEKQPIRQVELCYDLLDCQIDCCSLNVLALFTENFDYQDLRRDFLRGLLQSEVLAMRVATHVLSNGQYATRVRTPHLYASISQDIMSRWVFPLVPDANLLEDGEQGLVWKRGHIYQAPDVVVARTAQIGPCTILSAGVTVGEGSTIRRSVVGPGCRIGADCHLDGAYLWEGVRVEAACRLTDCILSDRVLVRTGTVIEAGCLLTLDLTVGPRVTIPPKTRVAKWSDHLEAAMSALCMEGATDHSSINRSSLVTPRPEILGADSDGILWVDPEDSSNPVKEDDSVRHGSSLHSIDHHFPDYHESQDEEEATAEAIRLELGEAFAIGSAYHLERPLYFDSESEFSSLEDDDFTSEDDQNEGKLLAQPLDANVQKEKLSQFHSEAVEMVRHAIRSNYAIENAILELNGLKFACNASFGHLQSAIIEGLFRQTDPSQLPTSVRTIWSRWSGGLLGKFTQGRGEQMRLLEMLRGYCAEHPLYSRAFSLTLPLLYQSDVVEEEAILQWYATETERTAGNSEYCRQIKAFVTWLEVEGSEEEDSNDDE